MSSFADESLVSDFVAESREHMDSIEPDLLAMEQEGEQVSQEIINRVFRAIHSTKGGAGFLAFEGLKRLSHAMESVLMLVRDGKMKVSSELMDILLAGVDKLRVMIDDIHASESVPIEEELAQLNVILESGGVRPNTQVKAQTVAEGEGEQEGVRAFDLDTEAVRSALAHGMNLYSATAYIHKDIQDKNKSPLDFLNNTESVGQCLDAIFDIQVQPDINRCLEEDLTVTFMIATVLEEDLVAMAIELPEEQISLIDVHELKKSLQTPSEQELTQEPQEQAAQPKDLPGKPASSAGEKGTAAMSAPAQTGAEQAPKTGGQVDIAETLRVRVDLLTNLMNTAGELVLSRNQLLRVLEDHVGKISGLPGILQNIDLVTTELQEGIMQTRMQPIGSVFNRFTRVVRDMARQLNKQISLEIEGAEVELDKSIIELLTDPLTHIVRNCVDHAIEMPEERQKKGKDPMGKVRLRAYHEAGQVNIAISDDGRGIDAKRVAEKAVEKGVVRESEVERMTERDIINLVFAPGFSTAEKISDISGRGVGMDVVRTNIEKLGGHIEVDTEVDMGTAVLLRLPLTLAIIPSLVVGTGGNRFAVPQVNLVELVWVKASEVKERIESVHGSSVLRLRGRLLPLVSLAEVLGMERTYEDPGTGEAVQDRRKGLTDRRSGSLDEPVSEQEMRQERSREDRRKNWRGDYNILVLQVGANQFGLVVDELFDSEEIVVKPLANVLKDCRCFAGATILGDGRVIMILDVSGLAARANLRFTDLEEEEKRRMKEEARKEAEAAASRRSVIFFNSAEDEFFAVSQEQVLRLERIEAKDIERVGNAEFIQYLGSGLPLLRLDNYFTVKPLPTEAQELFLIIPKHIAKGEVSKPRAGILVSRIVDAMDVSVTLEQTAVSGPGLQGSAIVQDKLTLFLDPIALVDASGVSGGIGE